MAEKVEYTNWYKYAKVQKTSGSLTAWVFKMLAMGIAAGAIVTYLAKNHSIPEQMAEKLVANQQRAVENLRGQGTPYNIGLDQMKDRIKNYERLQLRSYQDTEHNRSVGYGFNLSNPRARTIIESMGLDYDKVLEGNQSITKDQAERLFEISFSDAQSIANTFAPNFNQLPSGIQYVLIDMSYNLGNRIFTFRNMKEAVANQDWRSMANEMVDSKWYNQVGNRSKELVNIVKSYE